jgi:hypothetical protein
MVLLGSATAAAIERCLSAMKNNKILKLIS